MFYQSITGADNVYIYQRILNRSASYDCTCLSLIKCCECIYDERLSLKQYMQNGVFLNFLDGFIQSFYFYVDKLPCRFF